MFDGKTEIHFFRMETPDGLSQYLSASYKAFASIVRHCSISGLVDPLCVLFPNEYTEKDLSENLDKVVKQNSRCFGSRQSAEITMLPQGKEILEIGVAQGSHATSLITNLEPVSYTGIDVNFSQLKDESKIILQQAASNGVTINLINQPSSEALKNLSRSNKKYDIVYIDANHWHTFVANELSYMMEILNPGGTVVLNDYTDWFVGSMEPCGVKKAVDEFLSNQSGRFSLLYFAISDCDLALNLNS